MATGNETATFSVVLDDQVSGPADDAARAVEDLNERLAAEEAAVKQASAALRRLRGSTDEVKAAKEQLKARVNAGRDALSAMQLTMLRNSDAMKVAADRTKRLEDRTKLLAKQKLDAQTRAKQMGASINAVGGPVASLRARLDSLKEIVTGAGGSMNLLALGMVGLVAAAAALVVGVGAAVFSLGKFIVNAGSAARSANLLREAASGSASNAEALGTQVDALARKVPTAKGALNELAVSLAKGGVQGQTLVDTLNAVGQANAALGDDAGGKLRSLVDRGRLTQRFSIGFDELQGTGLQTDNVAAELARNMRIGVDAARKALAEGRVKLEDGAKALRDAVERKFSGINARRLLDINVIAEKMKERFASLTTGVNLEPLLKGFEKIASVFDETTVTGAALKQLVTVFGTGLAKSVELAAPIVRRFFQGMIIASLQVGITVLKLRNWFRQTFGDQDVLKGIDVMTVALVAGKAAIGAMAFGVASLAAVLVPMVVALRTAADGFAFLKAKTTEAWDFIKSIDWVATGGAIVDGLIDGIKARANRLVDSVKGLADKVKSGFTDALQIRSPSRVFARYGENTVEGFEQGVSSKTPDAAKALDGMASPPSPSVGGRGGTVTINVPVTINVNGGASDMAKQVSDPSFLAPLIKALEEALLSAGVPVRA